MAFDKEAARRRILDQVAKAVQGAEEKSAREGLAIAKRQTSGPFSAAFQRQLAKASPVSTGGRGLFSSRTSYPGPFSTRRTHPLLPADVMNKQSGVLARSWEIVIHRSAWGNSAPIIRNIASYAQYMEGTSKMHKRDVRSAVLTMLQPIREANIAAALDSLISK